MRDIQIVRVASGPAFIATCIPTCVARPPGGDGWIHEPKLDGWRVQVLKHDGRIAIFTRTGRIISDRVPDLIDLCHGIKARSCVLDGELLGIGAAIRCAP